MGKPVRYCEACGSILWNGRPHECPELSFDIGDVFVEVIS